jgi:hypothetical protein
MPGIVVKQRGLNYAKGAGAAAKQKRLLLQEAAFL